MHRLANILAGAAAGALLVHERRARQAAERFVAAALETLLAAIDANDAQTGAHVRRVARYALILAEEAGLDDADRHHVERIALFHDIGKIHEALFDIIHDGTSLSDEERRAIAEHPRVGAEVLAPLGAFYPELPEGVLSHHECWDGSGYPRALRGRRIPLAARIVAIADTFDAITQGRRYREGRSAEAAADTIAAGRGTQFDPELVDLFLFPPVFERVRRAMRDAVRLPRAARHDDRGERRQGEVESRTPMITFRWRNAAHVPHVPDPEHRRSP